MEAEEAALLLINVAPEPEAKAEAEAEELQGGRGRRPPPRGKGRKPLKRTLRWAPEGASLKRRPAFPSPQISKPQKKPESPAKRAGQPLSPSKKPLDDGKDSCHVGSNRPFVKTSSLFRNNPEVPEIKRVSVQQVQEEVFTSDSFNQLGLHPHLVSTITSVLNISSLTSRPETGKTLAYVIPLVQSLQRLEPKIQRSDGPYALILVPTRELALQSFETVQKLLKSDGDADKARDFSRKAHSERGHSPEERRAKKSSKKRHSSDREQSEEPMPKKSHTSSEGHKSKDHHSSVSRARSLSVSRPPSSLTPGLSSVIPRSPPPRTALMERSIPTLQDPCMVSDSESEGEIRADIPTLVPQEPATHRDRGVLGTEADDSEHEAEADRVLKAHPDLVYDRVSRRYLMQVDPDTLHHMKGRLTEFLRVHPFTWIVPGVLMGGEKKKSEKARLRKGINVLIATPGRLVDHINSTQCVHFRHVQWLILDEADRILDLGFEKALTVILNAVNADSAKQQSVLLSATLTEGVSRLANISLQSPVCISVVGESQDLDTTEVKAATRKVMGDPAVREERYSFAVPEKLQQNVVVVPSKLRLVTLAAFILGKFKGNKMVVFFSSYEQVDFHHALFQKVLAGDLVAGVHERLQLPPSALAFVRLHGDMKQEERTAVFQDFLQSKTGILLCTDVAARGLDLPQVTWIVQYNPPASLAEYVHRIGRTARIGSHGNSLLILAPSEAEYVSFLASHKIKKLGGGCRLNGLQIRFGQTSPRLGQRVASNLIALYAYKRSLMEIDLDKFTVANETEGSPCVQPDGEKDREKPKKAHSECGCSLDGHRSKKASKCRYSSDRERSKDSSSKKSRPSVAESSKPKDPAPSGSQPSSPLISRPPRAGPSSLVPRSLPSWGVATVPMALQQESRVLLDSESERELREDLPVLTPQPSETTHWDCGNLVAEADDSAQEEMDPVLKSH
ncbi:hypothetical protein JD844_004570 [Phrynosoma platyrhinos]|uniref:ATP-dependent RNA helicase n=1 Tax=Phrynosoma platyrhinos TaxID=52577 RepID=A0ABQ7SDH8_PHRPL|nr:hypothetical protein JD844_004570 [Phrynosoma platyrhinos]